MTAHEVDDRRPARALPGLRSRAVSGSDGYTIIGYAVIAAVILAALAGAIVLISMIVSSLSSDDAASGVASPTASIIAPCAEGTWLDAATGTCVPKAACTENEVFNPLTNTCSIVAPTVDSISPETGPQTGGTQVTITGTQFRNGATVTIDGQPASDVSVVDDTTITATVPPGLHLYPVDVVITNPGGDPVSLDNSFTYAVPQEKRLKEVRPPRGSRSGGETVVIKGQGLVPGAKVVFNGVPGTDVVVVDDTTITVTTPPGDLGPVNVNVKNPDEPPFVLVGGFTYVDVPPRIVSSVRPKKGPTAGGTKVTIAGSGFASGATVRFGGVLATDVTVLNDATIKATTPAGIVGPADVSVRNPGIPPATLAKGFEYVEAPTVASVSPTRVSTAGGTKLTVKGSGFVKGARVTVDGVPAGDVKVVSSSTITATAPAGQPGPAKVTVVITGQLPGSLPKAFVYVAEAPQPQPKPSPVALPACAPFSLPDVTTAAGVNAVLSANALFPASTGVKGASLTAVVFTGASGDDSDGSVSWKESPPTIVWRTPAEPGKSGTITFSYRASSCTGTARGVTVRVSSS